jgi:hypothetical protein
MGSQKGFDHRIGHLFSRTAPRTCGTQYHPELKLVSDLTILYHLIDKDEGWNKKVVVGTVI